MAEQLLKFRITGLAPLIVHNGQTADPMNRFAKMMKQISSKRSKTDADYEEMARIEWFASLYLDKGRMSVPGIVWESALTSAAKKLKLGQTVQAGLFVPSSMILDFPSQDRTPDEIWSNEELREVHRFTIGVRVQRNKIMRTRCIYPEWAGLLEVHYFDDLLNRQQVIDILKVSGSVTGLCEWRPRYGRFSVDVV
jgi:hypothetical protein